MPFHCLFDPLRLDANIPLRHSGGAVLQQPLDQGNVIASAISTQCSGNCSGDANPAMDNVIPFEYVKINRGNRFERVGLSLSMKWAAGRMPVAHFLQLID